MYSTSPALCAHQASLPTLWQELFSVCRPPALLSPVLLLAAHLASKGECLLLRSPRSPADGLPSPVPWERWVRTLPAWIGRDLSHPDNWAVRAGLGAAAVPVCCGRCAGALC